MTRYVQKRLLLSVMPLLISFGCIAQSAQAQDNESRALEKAFAEAYQQKEPDRPANTPGALPATASSLKIQALPPVQSRELPTAPQIPIRVARNPMAASQTPPTIRSLPSLEPEEAVAGQALPREQPQQSPELNLLQQESAPEFAPSPTIVQAEERDPLSMWWHSLVIEPIDERETQTVDPELLIHLALQHSPRILATSKRPLIRESEIGEARAEFDPEIFLKTQFDDRVDPVGNELTTGTGDRFLLEHIWYGDAGVRRKTSNGALLEAKQRLGFHNSNSRFFDPQDQGTATLSLNYTQPLLRGRGKAYNRSQILIAQIGTTASWDQFAAELQDELTELVEAYWTLYFNRAVLLQKQYNVERGEIVLLKLEGRSGLDSLPSQIARARSAVQLRRTELANARRDVKNAETDIRRLTGSMDNFQALAPELLPGEVPNLYRSEETLADVIQLAMQQRPEVKQAVQRARIAAVQKDVSQHELLPELNLIFDTYVAALRGESDIPGSFVDQFNSSTPGYAVGLEFNLPYGRRAAKARNFRQQMVLEQVRHEVDATVNNVVAEAQMSWRKVDSAYLTTVAAAEAVKAARTDLLQNEVRWESFALVEGDFAEGQTPTTLLDQLLDAQQRLAIAELTFSQSMLEFKKAEIELKRSTGSLLNHHAISATTGYCPPVDATYGIPTQPRPQTINPGASSEFQYPAQDHPSVQQWETPPAFAPR